MNRRTSALAVFVLLCVACVAHALYYYPRLPEQVAQHWGVSGQPDAWTSRLNCLIVYLVTVAATVIVFLGVALGTPKIPDSLLSLPHKEYWLAPERRRQTYDYIASSFLWLGSATMLLLLDVFQQLFQVNLGKATTLDHPWISVGVYLLVATVWCVALIRKFTKKESQPTGAS